MLERYQPSGSVGPLAIPLSILAALVLAALSWIYQALVDWIPFIYLNLLATLGFALLIGLAAGLAATFGRCRSPVAGALLGLVCGTAALAGSFGWAYQRGLSNVADWLVEEHGMTEDDAGRTAAEEFTFEAYIDARVENGWTLGRSSSGSDLSGVFVWLVWLIEGSALLGGGIWGGWTAGKNPYCEACNDWASQEEVVLVRSDLTPEAVERIRGALGLDEVLDHPVGAPSDFRVEYETSRCTTCEDSTYLTVSRHWTEVDKKGKSEDKSEELHANLHVGRREIERLAALRAQLEPAQPTS